MEKPNIAELLKDCPSGMEFDCTMYNKVTLINVDDRKDIIYPIKVFREDGNTIALTKYGQYTDANFAKCVIFPKGKTTWEGFVPPIQFNEGDIIYNRHQRRICILHYHSNGLPCISYCRYNCYHNEFEILKDDLIIVKQDYRLATEDEKEKLFQSIKDNGYKWNAETKTLEKLPKFKVGDRIKHKTEKFPSQRTIKCYTKGIGYFTTINDYVRIEDQDEWELVVPDKFDITTLKPFDKVLVRNRYKNLWIADLFSYISKSGQFVCVVHTTGQCIPYEGNEHLLGTLNDCGDYYKTWI